MCCDAICLVTNRKTLFLIATQIERVPNLRHGIECAIVIHDFVIIKRLIINLKTKDLNNLAQLSAMTVEIEFYGAFWS